MHKDKAFISVVVPTLNAGKWLPDCLESLAVQTYKNFEVMVVDGGSADNTVEVVEFFKATSDLQLAPGTSAWRVPGNELGL